MPSGHALDHIDERLVLFHVLGTEARSGAAKSIRFEPFERYGPGEKPATEWAIRHETDPEFPQRRQYA
jgi:hypothetical protein